MIKDFYICLDNTALNYALKHFSNPFTRINIMQIMKFITAVVCFSLFGFAVYSMNQSKASPLPALICACMLYVVDGIISHILIKKGHENSPYFDPKHQWKYFAPIYAVGCLIIIVIYKYLL